MIVITHRTALVRWQAELILPFETTEEQAAHAAVERRRSRVFLERGEILRDGDLLAAEDGRVVRVRAQSEAVVDILCDTTRQLVRVAYHLGNRHVPLQIGDGWLRIADDAVLGKMAEGLGAVVSVARCTVRARARRVFGRPSSRSPATHGGVIHEFGSNWQ